MRKIIILLLVLLSSCTLYERTSYDDLYQSPAYTSPQTQITESTNISDTTHLTSNFTNPYDALLVEDFAEAYEKRREGLMNPYYGITPTSLSFSDAYWYASAFDPAFYNIIIMGDLIWVEPNWLSAMFNTKYLHNIYDDRLYYEYEPFYLNHPGYLTHPNYYSNYKYYNYNSPEIEPIIKRKKGGQFNTTIKLRERENKVERRYIKNTGRPRRRVKGVKNIQHNKPIRKDLNIKKKRIQRNNTKRTKTFNGSTNKIQRSGKSSPKSNNPKRK